MTKVIIQAATEDVTAVELAVYQMAKAGGGEIELAIDASSQGESDQTKLSINDICDVIRFIDPTLYTKLVLPKSFWQDLAHLASDKNTQASVKDIIDAIPEGLLCIDIHSLSHLDDIELKTILVALAMKGAKELSLLDKSIEVVVKNKVKFKNCQQLVLTPGDALSLNINSSLLDNLLPLLPLPVEIKITDDIDIEVYRRQIIHDTDELEAEVSKYHREVEKTLNTKILARRENKRVDLADGTLGIVCRAKIAFKRCQELVLSSSDAQLLDDNDSMLDQLNQLMPALMKIGLSDGVGTVFERSLNLKIQATKRSKKLTLASNSIDLLCAKRIIFRHCQELVLSSTDAQRLDNDASLLNQVKRCMPSLTKISVSDGNDENLVRSLRAKVKPRSHSFLGKLSVPTASNTDNKTNQPPKTGHKRNRSLSGPPKC